MKKIRAIILLAVTVAVFLGIRKYLAVEENTVGTELTLHGNIDIRDADLAFNEQERIARVLVEEGDQVSKGQILARLQTNRLQAQIRETAAQVAAQQEVVKRLVAGTRRQEIDQARAEVAAAKARVRNSKLRFDRISATAAAGATSKQALDDIRSQLDVDRADLKVKQKALSLALEGPRQEDIAAAKDKLQALQAAMALLRIRLKDMTLVAPAAGVIQNRIMEPGEMAGPSRPVLTLALTDPKWVRAYVAEPNLGRIKLGMKARISCDSFPKKTFTGWVGFISPVAEFTPKNVETEDLRTKLVYEVRVFVHDAKDQLRLGMPVTVTVDENAAPVAPGSGKAGVSQVALPAAG